ncbi:MAG: NosD domain-containing protein [Thermoplasmata archaeon]
MSDGNAYAFAVSSVDTNVPYRIVGNGGKAYFGSLPSGIVIDGAFGDWQGVEKGSDVSGDASQNIDLREYASAIASNAYFYMAVDGTMLAGCEIPVLGARPPVQPGPPTPVVIKENLGTDVARVYIDLMNSTINTFNPAMISHGYLIELQGRNGQVVSARAWKWENGVKAEEIQNPNIAHGLSDGKIEFSVAGSALAGLNNDTKFYFEMTNWLGEKDASEIAYRAGKIQQQNIETNIGTRGTPHAPIHINGNSQFTSENGVVSGSGTPADPYIIEGWDINANGGTYGIWIENTNVYFVIRNCNITNATNSGSFPHGSGIALNNVMNGTIENNKCNNSRYGIYLYGGSKYNNINNNNCSGNSIYGIRLYIADNNTIMNNIATSNSDTGIHLYSANNNSVINNNASNNNNHGIYSYSSSKNNIIGNNASGNLQRGIYLYVSDNHNISNNTCVNNSNYGIYLDFSSYNNLSGNNASFGLAASNTGIYLVNSHWNNLTNNTACYNQGTGIYISFSGNNTLIGNNASFNSLSGSTGRGIHLYYANNTVMINNSACNNSGTYGYGIYLSNSNWCNIRGNNVSGNNGTSFGDGLYLYFSSNNTLSRNKATSNKRLGVYLDVSAYNNITENIVSNNGGTGIYIYGSYQRSQYNRIFNNNVSRNSNYGISLEDDCNYTTITYNWIFNNGQYGIYIDQAKYCTIHHNTLMANNGATRGYTGNCQAYTNVGYSNWYEDSITEGNYWSNWNGLSWGTLDAYVINWSLSDPPGARVVDRYPLGMPVLYPLNITTNEDFAFYASLYGWNGAGTNINPYIIDRYYINGNGTLNCTYIANTDVSFVIQNCLVKNATQPQGNGIYLFNVNNATLFNNTIRNARYGIYLGNAGYTEISKNDITGIITWGITLSNSMNITVSNNRVYAFSNPAIYLWFSNSNQVVGNQLNNTSSGIYLYSSSKNTIVKNHIWNQTGSGVYLYGGSTENIISSNNVSFGNIGIDLQITSDNNEITYNWIYNNTNYGIYILLSAGNRIHHNNLVKNRGATKGISDGWCQAYADNSLNQWSWLNEGNYWSNWDGTGWGTSSAYPINGGAGGADWYPLSNRTFAPLHIVGNEEFVFYAKLYGWPGAGISANPYIIDRYYLNGNATGIPSSYNIWIENTNLYFRISNSTIRNATDNIASPYGAGIAFISVTNGVVDNNTVTNNVDGIYIKMSNGLNIKNNNISFNSETGIDIYECSYLTITGNTMYYDGIHLDGGQVSHWNTHMIQTTNTVNGKPIRYYSNQTGSAVDTLAGQIILANCIAMTVNGVAINNTTTALLIGFSRNTTITNNNFSDCRFCAIFMRNTENDTIKSNVLLRNTHYGVYSNSANNTEMEWNLVSDNVDYGICIVYFTYGRISNNTVLRNNYGGMALFYGGNNTLLNNNISQNYLGLIISNSGSNTVTYNTFRTNMNYAVQIYSGCTNNVLHHNNFFQNRGATKGNSGLSQAYDISGASTWYTGYQGNYWSNWDGHNWSSSNAYPIDGGVAADFFPLKLPTRLPIRINSNADFTPANGVKSGTGSPWDPYIISDWEIDGTGYGSCIYIGNTTAYFFIKNCYLHNATGNGNLYYDNAAVQLRNVKNGTVKESVILNSTIGVYICQNSAGITVHNNTISNGGDFGQGVYIQSSSNNTITNNTIFDNYNGIYIAYSPNNTIENNTIYSNGQHGIYIYDADNNTIQRNNIHHNTQAGIYSNYGDSNVILFNEIHENNDGVKLTHSTFNIVSENNMSNNFGYGLYIYDSNNNVIKYNKIHSCGEGILIDTSDSITIFHNNISQSGTHGLRFAYSSTGTIVFYNIFYANTNFGVCIADGATAITIHHNSFIMNNGAGKGVVGNNQAYDEVGGNSWYDDTAQEGNYWSNWDGKDWGTSDAYWIGGYETSDHYPLSKPVLPPLHINGNAEFAYYAAFYGWDGNGTPSNPYRISKYYINGEGFAYCIWIENTTVYFNVTDCDLRNASLIDDDPHGAGIAIYNGSNGTIGWNNIANNWVGVFLNNALNCSIVENNLTHNGIAIFGDAVEAWTSHEIDTTNIVNGQPVYYYKDRDWITVPEDAGQVLIANCTNIIVANITTGNATMGVEAGFSSGLKIMNMSSYYNLFGAMIVGCDDTQITNSTFDTSYVSGVEIQFSTNVVIEENEFSATSPFGDKGIGAYHSLGLLITRNEINNIRIGILFETCPLSQITQNVINYRGENWNDAGVRIYNSSYAFVAQNQITSIMGDGCGIFLEATDNDTISNNDISGNPSGFSGSGIIVEYSESIRLSENIVYNHLQYAIYITASTRCDVRDNNIYSSYYGIFVYSANSNNVTYNEVIGNNYGIQISNANNNNITYNSVTSNSVYGIGLASASSNKIFHNAIAQNNIGMYIFSSSTNNNITYNNFSWNIGYGISIVQGSSSNIIHYNTFIANNGATRDANGNRQAKDDVGGNSWYNGTNQKGNYWSNWDGDGWGTASAYPIDGMAGASDWYPLSEPAMPKLPRLHIIGNANFSYFASIYGWLGNGAAWDPYIIDGYEIDGEGDSYSIWIENTNVYFIIQNCKVWNATNMSANPGGSGMALWNVSNGTIYNNAVIQNANGIYLSVCHGSNLIVGNNVRTNSDVGISVDTCEDISIYSNVVESNNIGISLVYSSSCTIYDNHVTGNNGNGIYLYDTSTYNYVGYNIINSNNNHGIYLKEGCDYNIIEYNDVGSNSNGICLDQSNYNTITNNTVAGNDGGIYLSSSSYNTITNNNVINNNHDGIQLVSSSNNNNITNNNASENLARGIYLNSSNYNKLTDNTVSDNLQYGIFLQSSTNNNITNNNAANNSYGIYLEQSSANILSGNTVHGNAWYGIIIHASSNYNVVKNNNVSSNIGYGISLWNFCGYNNISENFVVGNNGVGIGIYYSSYNDIYLNNVSEGNEDGIRLWASSNNNNITYNTLYHNTNYGINITDSSTGNYIYHNYFIGNNGAGKGVSGSCQAYDEVGGNIWYNGTLLEGNQWSNWDGNGWGTSNAYPIDGGAGASDWYPLGGPVNELSVLPIFGIVILGILLMNCRRRK